MNSHNGKSTPKKEQFNKELDGSPNTPQKLTPTKGSDNPNGFTTPNNPTKKTASYLAMATTETSSTSSSSSLFQVMPKTSLGKTPVSLHSAAEQKQEDFDIARAISYEKLETVILQSPNFENQAKLAAIEKMIQNLNRLHSAKKTTFKMQDADHQSLKADIQKKIQALIDEKKKLYDLSLEEIQKLGGGFKLLHERLYANVTDARSVMPDLFEMMLDNEPILKALQEINETREAQNIPSNPTMLIAVGKMPETEESKEERYCILALSSPRHSLNFINALKTELEGKKFLLNGLDYKIIISDRLSYDFQILISTILEKLNNRANLSLKSQMQSLENEIKIPDAVKSSPHFEKTYFPSDSDCVTQHEDDKFKECAERFFVSDYAKGLMIAGIQKSSFIQIEGIDCLSLTLYGDKLKKANSKDNPDKIPKSERIPVKVRPSVYNTYLKRPADPVDEIDSEEKLIYFMRTVIPCEACRINKVMVYALFIGIAQRLKETQKDTNAHLVEGLLSINPVSSISPSKKTPPASNILRNFIDGTPLSTGFLKMDLVENYHSRMLIDECNAVASPSRRKNEDLDEKNDEATPSTSPSLGLAT